MEEFATAVAIVWTTTPAYDRDLPTVLLDYSVKHVNQGTKPGRAKPEKTKESKEKYIADTRKAARLPAIVSEEKAEWENDDRQDLEVTDESMMMEVRHAGPPLFVFFCKDLPTLRAMIEGEALKDPRVENLDPRNLIPKFSNELEAIRDALGVTIDHFKEIFRFESEIGEGSDYISEYCNIQDQMDVFFPDDAIALRRLGPWEALMDPRVDNLEGQVVDILLEILMQKLLAALGKTSAISSTVSSVFTHNAKF